MKAKTKRHTIRTSFDWFRDSVAAETHGEKAAEAFAKEMRAEVHQNQIVCWVGLKTPRVVAGDAFFEDWTVSTPLEALLAEGIKRVCYDGDLRDLVHLLRVLDRISKKARDLLDLSSTVEYPPSVPDEGTEPG